MHADLGSAKKQSNCQSFLRFWRLHSARTKAVLMIKSTPERENKR